MWSRSRWLFFALCWQFGALQRQQERRSPCPGIFDYEFNNHEGRWDGVVRLQTDEELQGVFVTVVLDGNANRLVNWFGETVTRNNREFTIRNGDYVLVPGINVTLKFYVEYDDADAPNLTAVRLNGRTICSERKKVKPLPSPAPFVSVRITPRATTTPPYTTRRSTTWQTLEADSRSGDATSSTTERDIDDQPLAQGSSSRPRPRPNLELVPPYLQSPSDRNRTVPSLTSTERSVPASGYVRNRTTVVEVDKFSNNTYTGGVFANTMDRDIQKNIDELLSEKYPVKYPKSSHGETVQASNTTYIEHITHSLNHHVPNVSAHKCGTTTAVKASPLILYGENTTEGEWPWHAALYLNNFGTLKYICGGNLISDRFVITAAHCVTSRDTGDPQSPNNFLLYFGTTSIKSFSPTVQTAQISRIRVHPDYNSGNFHNDIAVLKTSRPVELTDYAKPICLWESDTNLNSVVGSIGTVVGWGLDENNIASEVLKKTEMPIVDKVTCIYSNPDFFARFTSLASFCAGFRNGSSACNGDSGSGLVLKWQDSNGSDLWYLRGIVSVSVPVKEKIRCDPYQYIVFTDVAKFTDWIRRVMRVD